MVSRAAFHSSSFYLQRHQICLIFLFDFNNKVAASDYIQFDENLQCLAEIANTRKPEIELYVNSWKTLIFVQVHGIFIPCTVFKYINQYLLDIFQNEIALAISNLSSYLSKTWFNICSQMFLWCIKIEWSHQSVIHNLFKP